MGTVEPQAIPSRFGHKLVTTALKRCNAGNSQNMICLRKGGGGKALDGESGIISVHPNYLGVAMIQYGVINMIEFSSLRRSWRGQYAITTDSRVLFQNRNPQLDINFQRYPGPSVYNMMSEYFNHHLNRRGLTGEKYSKLVTLKMIEWDQVDRMNSAVHYHLSGAIIESDSNAYTLSANLHYAFTTDPRNLNEGLLTLVNLVDQIQLVANKFETRDNRS